MIPHNQPQIGQEEQDAASRVLASGQLVSGKETEAFEAEMCDFLHLPHGHSVFVSSGSAALFITLSTLGLADKKVAIPSYVCSSLRHACRLANASPSVCDIKQYQPSSMQLPNEVQAVIQPYLYGIPAELATRNLPVIEDCAQSLGGQYAGEYLGTRGTCGVLSFYATKLITTGGQGGMIISKNKDFILSAKDFLNFDMRQDKQFRFNLSATEMQAAIGRIQLAKYPQWLTKRAEIFSIYQQAGLPLLTSQDPLATAVHFRAIVICKNPKEVISKLADYGYKAIIPIEDWELLDKTKNAYELARHTVSLPIYPSLELHDARNIAELTSHTMRHYANIN